MHGPINIRCNKGTFEGNNLLESSSKHMKTMELANGAMQHAWEMGSA